jgi:hypothetical protein
MRRFNVVCASSRYLFFYSIDLGHDDHANLCVDDARRFNGLLYALSLSFPSSGPN